MAEIASPYFRADPPLSSARSIVPGAHSSGRNIKSVQYVKICSLYGAGFYYIPGTDMCIKVGGWVRQYTTYNTNGNSSNGPLVDNVNNRSTRDFEWRSRGYITADSRSQTAFGTVRGYIAVGLNSEYAGGSAQAGGVSTFSSNRAFIQWAGFTFGLASSFFDFYSGPATSYWGAKINPSEDTGDGGAQVWAYTAQFGNGWSATISAEGNRTQGVWNTATTGIATTGVAYATSGLGGTQTPDFVGNMRVDQAWGSAQIMGALHQVRGLYYGTTDLTGNPSDKWGFAVGGGIKLNAPMIGKGDYLQAEVNYTQGAVGYLNAGSNARYAHYDSDTSYGTGALFDGIYGATGDIELTTGWGVNAAYQHQWNAQWKTSVYGTYQKYTQNGNGNLLTCAGFGVAAAACASGASDWSYSAIGTRTQWNVTKDFYLGVDVIYVKLGTMFDGSTLALPATTGRPAGAYTFQDQDAWSVQFRAHKDFYP